MGSEVMNFLNRKAWTKIPRDKADRSGKKILKVKWVFKKKDEQDGSTRYKSRIVTKGYLQTGVDYTESFAPVATDTTIVCYHNCFCISNKKIGLWNVWI
jgi:hypothetical protein